MTNNAKRKAKQLSAPPQDSPASPPGKAAAPHVSLIKRSKKLAWRATAAYFWGWLILSVFGVGHLVYAGELRIASMLAGELNLLSFTASSPSHLITVFKVGWVLLVTGYNLLQLAGLFFYVLLLPFWIPLYLFFKDTVAATQSSESKAGLRPAEKQRPVVALTASSLLGWYVLFGASNGRGPLWTGVVISGMLLLALSWRAFQRARPVTYDDTVWLVRLEKWGSGASNYAKTEWEKHKGGRKHTLHGTMKIYRLYKFILIEIATFIRGKRGRNRIYVFIVLQYAASLIFLASSAVLFWAFYTRAILPVRLPIAPCLLLSAAHFLPGLSSLALPVRVPLSASLGPGITAWILLGVYLAASSSLLPGNQAAYAQRVHLTYAVLRHGIVELAKLHMRVSDLPE